MSEGIQTQTWRDELIRLGGSIHQDEDPPLSDEEDAVQQAGVERYQAMLDSLSACQNFDTETIHRTLGGSPAAMTLDSIPSEWPEDWKAAAKAFRKDGRITLAWTDERDFPSNFPRVLALMELHHGPRWRDVPDCLNPLFVRRHKEIPAFVAALAALSDSRRERILTAVRRARPDTAERLKTMLRETERR